MYISSKINIPFSDSKEEPVHFKNDRENPEVIFGRSYTDEVLDKAFILYKISIYLFN